MSEVQISASMVEAGAKVLDRFLIYDGDEEVGLSDGAIANAVLAAALGVCEVTEEWGVQLQPGFVPLPDRRAAELWIELRGVGELARRLSITTPAEQVDTEGAKT